MTILALSILCETHSLLALTVGGGERLRDVGLGQDVVQPVQIGLVRVGGSVRIRNERRGSTRAVVDIGSRIADSFGILDVEVGLI